MKIMQIFPDGTRIPVPGGKIIEEFIGVQEGQDRFSVAHMVMPAGWSETAHGTDFDEIVIVVKGELTVNQDGQDFEVKGGQVGLIEASKSVIFSNQGGEECEYWATCLPAYSPDRVHYPEGKEDEAHG